MEPVTLFSQPDMRWPTDSRDWSGVKAEDNAITEGFPVD